MLQIKNCSSCCLIFVSMFIIIVASEYSKARAKFSGIPHRPPESSRLSVWVRQSHLRQCMRECVLEERCLSAVYDEGLRACSLYDSSTPDGALSRGQTAVTRGHRETQRRIVCSDLVPAIVNISVSSYQSGRPASMAIDGDVTAANGWSAAKHGTKWLRLEFGTPKILEIVDILARCSVDREATGYVLLYDGGQKQVSRRCSPTTDCPAWERHLLGAVTSTYLTIEAASFCDGGYYYGIRELRLCGV